VPDSLLGKILYDKQCIVFIGLKKYVEVNP